MHNLKNLTISIILVMALVLAGQSFDVSAGPLAVHAPNLGVANSFAILAGNGAAITDADVLDTSSITGDVGMDAGASITGLTCAEVTGTIFDADAGYTGGGTPDTSCLTTDPGWGPQQLANSNAFADLIATDNSACTAIPAELGGQTLVAGVYCPLVGDFQLTAGNLALTAGGANVWIFQTAAGFTTAAGGTMTGGDSCSVWWRVPSSAVLGVGSALTGNILALTSITLNDATLNGRAFAQTGSVTMNGATVNRGPLCTPAAGGGGGGGGGGDGVSGLPNTGAAPIRSEDLPWSVVIIGGFGLLALVLGFRAYRRTHLPKQ